MKKVLGRLVEAARHYQPHADHLSVIGVDGELMINRYSNQNLGWMLAFITLSDDQTTLSINTVKYISKMGQVSKTDITEDSSIYDLIEKVRARLVNDNTISVKVGSELIRFADFVIMTNDETKTGYELTTSDLSRYQNRIHHCSNETA